MGSLATDTGIHSIPFMSMKDTTLTSFFPHSNKQYPVQQRLYHRKQPNVPFQIKRR